MGSQSFWKSHSRDRARKQIGLTQRDYIIQCAHKFKTTGMKPYTTPLEPGFVDAIDTNDKPVEKTVPYRSIIGALLYIARMTRPDVLFAVSVLSKHLVNPQIKHWNAAKRVLTYLYHTKDEYLVLGANNIEEATTLQCYTDSTWGDDINNRRSRSGGVMFMANCLISV